MTPKSKLEQVIQAAWAEKDVNKAKQLVIDLIEPSRINSKQQILDTLKSISNKGRLDQYLANSLLKFEKLGLSETEGKLGEDSAVPKDSTDMAIDMMKNGLPRESVKENKMTAREKYLTRLVENALGLEGHGDDNVYAKMEKRGDEPTQQAPTYSEGEEMVQPTIPEYKTIEELMTQIDKGTNKVAEEHKIAEMKRIAKLLREKAQNLEESEHAAHINPKDIKKLNDEAIKLDKAAAKFQAAYEKTYNKKGKAAAPKATEVEKPTLQEGNFDLKKFLVENKMTYNSRLLNERHAGRKGTDYDFVKSPEEDPLVKKVLEYLKQNYQEGVDFQYDSNMQRLYIYDDVNKLSFDETLVDLLSDVFTQPDYEDGY